MNEKLKQDLLTVLRMYRDLAHSELGTARDHDPAAKHDEYKRMVEAHEFEAVINEDLVDGKYFY